MVFTLHRYVFRELMKVFILAVVALTLILSLGSVLRPVQEYGVGPRQVVLLMGYFLPITLTFVLPMAALFAVSLVYGRFASDNELDACRASGIRLLTLVYPGATLAIIVTIANLILSFHVMPVFVHMAEKSLKADAKQILFRNIQRRGYYKLPPRGEYLIYADQVDYQNDTLLGVIVTEMKKAGIQRIITADVARITFNPQDRFNEVRVTAYNTYQIGPEDEGGFSVEVASLSAEFGSLLGDDIKFKKIGEMKRIQNDPMLFDPVAKLAYETYAQLAIELLAQDITLKTANDPNAFYQLYSGSKLIRFTASECTVPKKRELLLSGDVVVIEQDVAAAKPLWTLSCQKALLHIEGEQIAPTLTMDIYNATVEETGDIMMRHIVRGLVLPQSVESTANRAKTQDNAIRVEGLISDTTGLRGEPSENLEGLKHQLQREIMNTLVDIKAEIHSRLVFGIGCMPMILIGLGLGVIKRGGHLLSAFGVSCMPAAVLIVCIMSGKHLTENLGAQAFSGTALMWTGLVFLFVLAFGIYVKLLRN